MSDLDLGICSQSALTRGFHCPCLFPRTERRATCSSFQRRYMYSWTEGLHRYTLDTIIPDIEDNVLPLNTSSILRARALSSVSKYCRQGNDVSPQLLFSTCIVSWCRVDPQQVCTAERLSRAYMRKRLLTFLDLLRRANPYIHLPLPQLLLALSQYHLWIPQVFIAQ